MHRITIKVDDVLWAQWREAVSSIRKTQRRRGDRVPGRGELARDALVDYCTAELGFQRMSAVAYRVRVNAKDP